MVIYLIHFFMISQKWNENLSGCTFMVRKYAILWILSSLKILLRTKSMFFFMSDSFIFAESFRPNPQVARNTFDFFHLCPFEGIFDILPLLRFSFLFCFFTCNQPQIYLSTAEKINNFLNYHYV